VEHSSETLVVGKYDRIIEEHRSWLTVFP